MQKITAAGPHDLIALAWFRLGFRPRESLVVLGLRGPNRRVGMVLRFGLDGLGTPATAARRIATLLRRSGDREAVLLVVSDRDGGPREGPDGTPLLPHRRLVADLRGRLSRCRIAVFDVIAVGPRTFRSYQCEDVRCCPPGGTSLEAAMSTEVAATMVLAGLTVAEDERALLADVEPIGADGGAGPAPPADRSARDPQPPDLRRALQQWRAWLDTPVPGHPERDAPAVGAGRAGVLEALQELPFRDAVMLTLVPGAGTLPERLLAGDGVDEAAVALDVPPDGELAARGRRLLAELARGAPPGRRAEPLAVLAWMAWWCGDGARGRLLAERALVDCPGHRLAMLVSAALATGTPPSWVQAADGSAAGAGGTTRSEYRRRARGADTPPAS